MLGQKGNCGPRPNVPNFECSAPDGVSARRQSRLNADKRLVVQRRDIDSSCRKEKAILAKGDYCLHHDRTVHCGDRGGLDVQHLAS